MMFNDIGVFENLQNLSIKVEAPSAYQTSRSLVVFITQHFLNGCMPLLKVRVPSPL